MTKQDFIKNLVEIHKFLTIKQANEVFTTIFNLIKEDTKKEPFNIQGFGTFKYVEVKGKTGKIKVKSGEIKEYTTKPRKVFRLKSTLKEEL